MQINHRNLAYILIIVLGALQLLAVKFYLYWTVWWLDYVTHFLAGLGIGLLVLSFRRLGMVATIALVLMIGGAWEAYEYVFNVTYTTEGYVSDTVHDLLMGALGAGVATLLSRRESL